MAFLPGFPLSALESLLFILITIISGILVFFGGLWLVSLDRETQKYDRRLRKAIRENPAFSGIREAAEPSYIVTSDSRISKTIGRAKKLLGRSRRPQIIIPVDEDVIEPRKIEFIRQRSRNISGRNVLGRELIGAINSYYAYMMALNEEGVGSPVVEYFESVLEEYEESQKIVDLGKSANYEQVAFFGDSTNGKKDPLNDIFLPLVKAAESHCIDPNTPLDAQRTAIEECRAVLKFTKFLLWSGRMVGARVGDALPTEECESAYRDDLQDGENWGYWMLSADTCTQEEFKRLRHLIWRLDEVVSYHWEDEPFISLHPARGSIREMEYVETPFVIFHLEEAEVRGGGGANAS